MQISRLNKKNTDSSSPYNALHFMIQNVVRGMVNTAEVVKVVNVACGGAGEASGYVDVLPMVCQTDVENNTIAPVTLYRLPYSRIQGGIAALVIDPVPGDIGIAVFTKRDSSGVRQEQQDPVPPASFRIYSKADGFYIGGFLNKAPSIFLELDQDNNAVLTAPKSVTVNTDTCVINAKSSMTVECKTFTVNASESAGINAPNWSFNTYSGSGRGKGTINADLVQNGSLEQNGTITSSGDHTAGGISLVSHVHGGVQTGSGNTGTPR